MGLVLIVELVRRTSAGAKYAMAASAKKWKSLGPNASSREIVGDRLRHGSGAPAQVGGAFG
jgi:hypothetical protein